VTGRPGAFSHSVTAERGPLRPRWRNRTASRVFVLLSALLVPAAALIAAAAAPAPLHWKLVSDDNFNGTHLSSYYWSAYNSPKSLSAVSRFNPKLVGIAGGNLQVRAADGSGAGVCWCGHRPVSEYGRWEIRARTVSGDPGYETALLMWPTDNKWPTGGEIDISEIAGPTRMLSTTTLHYSAHNRFVQTGHRAVYGHWTNFELTWLPNSLTVTVNGVEAFHTTLEAAIPHDPMFLALQSQPTKSTPVNGKAVLQVSSIKIYRQVRGT
jgi:beta-glucanase (GH16 family)